MKGLLWLVLGLVTVFIISSCGSNNNDMMSTNGKTESPANDSVKVDDNPVKFPKNYENDVLYSTIKRGNITEPLYTSRKAIEAAKNGEPFPDGTIITLVIYKDGKLDETLVAEKRSDWGDQPSGEQNGDWRYQAFNSDRSVNEQRSIPTCISCHAGQEEDDFTFTSDRMRSFELEDIIGSSDSKTKTSVESITTEKAHTLSEHLARLAFEK